MKKFVLSFESWLNESALNESLPLSVVRPYSNIKRNKEVQNLIDNFLNAVKSVCSNSFFSRNGYRLYIPANDIDMSKMMSTTKYNILNFLDEVNKTGNSVISKAPEGDKEYKIIDYTGNKMHVPGQKNATKITKALQALGRADLKEDYCADPLRDNANLISPEKYIVISTHYYDIAGMSTNRRWTSCMNIIDQPEKVKMKITSDDDDYEDDIEEIESKLGNKVHIKWGDPENDGDNEIAIDHPLQNARDHVADDVENGSIIAYLINKKDMNIEDPIARILLKPYKMCNSDNEEIADSKLVYFPEQTLYGARIEDFRQKMIDICCNAQKELQGDWKEVWLKLIDNLYNDYATPVRNQNLNIVPDKNDIFDPENKKLGDEKYKEVEKTGVAHINRKGRLI